jgi:hypothetical protein
VPSGALRIVSYGGGVQSTALLVLAAEGRIDYRTFLFANVGDDSEHPATLDYVRTIAMPYAEAHGIELVELHRTWQRGERRGQQETLLSRLAQGRRSVPVRRSKNGPPMSRSCTADFKIKVIERELRRHGATATEPALVALGISVDEVERAHPGVDPRSPVQIRTYPLLARNEQDPHSDGLLLTRSDCRRVIVEAGLPVPPKSSCWFCPFHDRDAWRTLRHDFPHLFAEAVEIERTLTAKANDGRPVYLTRAGLPLDQVVADQSSLFDGMDGCDSGHCMT